MVHPAVLMQDTELRKAFGARLKALRKAKRWSQKELAGKVDIRFQQLNKYESGLNVPPADMLVKLADALATSVDYLLTGNASDESPLANSRLFKRFQHVEALSADDQETVIKIIDAMLAKQRVESALVSVDR
ncbi:MAG: helix-turn-helix domain-containing protein [Pseudomonadota bacterium]|jgi:transcriptional regulator with XRE-family HTH domain